MGTEKADDSHRPWVMGKSPRTLAPKDMLGGNGARVGLASLPSLFSWLWSGLTPDSHTSLVVQGLEKKLEAPGTILTGHRKEAVGPGDTGQLIWKNGALDQRKRDLQKEGLEPGQARRQLA